MAQSNSQQEKNSIRLLSGGIAGISARTFTAPFERIVILKQIESKDYHNQTLLTMVRNIFKNEGIASFWKGNGANCIRVFPYSAVELTTFEIYKQLFRKISADNKNLGLFISGGLAGMTASIVSYPLDLLRTLFASQTNQKIYKNLLESWIKIISDRGVKGLYSGLGATLLGLVPYSSIKLTTFQTLKDLSPVSSSIYNPNLVNFAYGGLSGCVAITLTYPTDLIRKRFQAMLLEKNIKMSYTEMIKNIYNSQGVSGFYRGLLVTYLKFIPLTAITLTANDAIKAKLK